jgi:hypothetical protein
VAAVFATAALVRTLAPEFVQATDDQIAPFLRISKNVVSAARFSSELDDAHALATAHLMKMDPGLTSALGVAAGSSAPVASMSHGPASVTFAKAAPDTRSDSWLSGSTYGDLFKVIRDRKRGAGSALRIGNSTPQGS